MKVANQGVGNRGMAVAAPAATVAIAMPSPPPRSPWGAYSALEEAEPTFFTFRRGALEQLKQRGDDPRAEGPKTIATVCATLAFGAYQPTQ